MNNPYQTLGVQQADDAKTIKSAYRKLAMQYHPDKNPGDEAAEQKFKEINAAYDILKDEEKRRAYDQYGEAAFQNGGPGAGGGNPFGGFGGGGGGFSDIFEDLFAQATGGRRGGGASKRQFAGSDLRYDMTLTLEEAFDGKKGTIKVPTLATCGDCDGKGGKGVETCGDCGGMGRVRMQQGFFMTEQTCASCRGTGETIKEVCGTCRGDGRVRDTHTLDVTIPAGVEDGMRMRLSGKGEAGLRGGPAGDLYIMISVKDHNLFARDNAHLHLEVPLAFTTAALGGAVEVPTIEGKKAKLTIPAGTQYGDTFRLKGKGMPEVNRGRMGDLYVHVTPEIPKKPTRKQKQLLEQLQELDDKSLSPDAHSFGKSVESYVKKRG